MFKKATIFCDIHLGLKSNSKIHNEDCLNFIDFLIDESKKNDCETCIFLGDWHHNRSAINISTLNYSIKAIDKLSNAFDQILMIPGNHDEYYRSTRELNSIEWTKKYENIRFFNEITNINDICMVPWLIEEEHKEIPKVEAKYMFGHFELPNFLMNAMVRMPDTGLLKQEDIKCENVYSGHFHKRQSHKNVTYIGNAFPHNYADAGDNKRGMMILEWDKKPSYIAWPDAPKYGKYKLSQVLENMDLLMSNLHCRIETDVDISYEETLTIKEHFFHDYGLRELSLIPQTVSIDNQINTDEIKTESIDNIVIDHIAEMDDAQYDNNLIIDIYRNL